MPNANAPRGFMPVCYVSGAPYNGAHTVYFVPATDAQALFIGDPVITVTAAADANGIPVVTRASGLAAAGAAIDTPMFTGAITGILMAGTPVVGFTRDSPVFRPASVAAYIAVADDPNLMFEMQEDSIGATFAATVVGRNAVVATAAGSTVTGYSGFQLDSSVAVVATNTIPVRVLRAVQRADNAIGAFCKWLVKINGAHHTMVSGTGI